MTTLTLKRILIIGLVAGAAGMAYFEHNRAERLAEEIQALRAQMQKVEATPEAATPAQTAAGESKADAQMAELLRLRGEVTRMRKAEAEVAKARQQEQMMRAQQQAALENQRQATLEAQRLARQQAPRADLTYMQVADLPAQEAGQVRAIGNNLRIIEGAKEQWALENRMVTTSPVTLANLTAYFKNNMLPAPIAGETYSVTTVGTLAQAVMPEGRLRNQLGPLTTTSF